MVCLRIDRPYTESKRNRNGLLMDFMVSRATGRAEREAVPVLLDDARQRSYRPRMLGGDRGYDTRGCVRRCVTGE